MGIKNVKEVCQSNITGYANVLIPEYILKIKNVLVGI